MRLFWFHRPKRGIVPGARLLFLYARLRRTLAATLQDEFPDGSSSIPTLRMPAVRQTRHITRILPTTDWQTRTMPTEIGERPYSFRGNKKI